MNFWDRQDQPPNPPRESPLRAAPIDMWKHMQTTLLCMNRKLEEKGLSRVIAGFHKDLSADDVMARLETIHVDAATSALAPTEATSICQEIFHYIHYFKSNGEIISKSCSIFYTLAESDMHSECMQLVIENVGGILQSHVVSHPDEDHFWYSTMATSIVCTRSGAWVDNYVDELLEFPTFRDGSGDPSHLVRMSLQTALQLYLARRRANRRFS